jgi:hypothetical protein
VTWSKFILILKKIKIILFKIKITLIWLTNLTYTTHYSGNEKRELNFNEFAFNFFKSPEIHKKILKWSYLIVLDNAPKIQIAKELLFAMFGLSRVHVNLLFSITEDFKDWWSRVDYLQNSFFFFFEFWHPPIIKLVILLRGVTVNNH